MIRIIIRLHCDSETCSVSATCSSLNLRKDCDVLQRSTLAAPDASLRWAYRCHMDFSLLTFSGVLEGLSVESVPSPMRRLMSLSHVLGYFAN